MSLSYGKLLTLSVKGIRSFIYGVLEEKEELTSATWRAEIIPKHCLFSEHKDWNLRWYIHTLNHFYSPQYTELQEILRNLKFLHVMTSLVTIGSSELPNVCSNDDQINFPSKNP